MKYSYMNIEETLNQAPNEQKLACPLSFLYLSQLQDFQYENITFLQSGLIIINGIYLKKSSSFLPVLHDYPINSTNYIEYSHSNDRVKYIAMTSSDGSVILYHIRESSI